MPERPYKIAQRTGRINPFRVMDVLRRARELEARGIDVIHMEVGEPDFTTAAPIVAAAKAALDKGYTGYSPAAGIPELRQALSGWYQTRYGVVVDPQRIFITPGASGGLNLLANLLLDPGAAVLLADPAYPCNRNFINLTGAIPQMVPVTDATHFQPTVDLLERYVTAQTSGLWLASPSNPTGTIIDRNSLQALCNWATQKNIHLVMDEIYHGLHYVEQLPSLLEFTEQGFVVNSFSKYFGMTGWRLGWIVVPEAEVTRVDILCQNLFISASTIAQHAALAAFAPETLKLLEQRRAEFRQRRDYLHTALKDLGFRVPRSSDGAFYIYAGIEAFADNSEVFCRQLLEEHGVALTPGTDFGDFDAQRYVRIAYTTSLDKLQQGVARLARALA